MGNVESVEHYHPHICLLRQLLKVGGASISEEGLVELLLAVDKYCCWFPSIGTLDLKVWEKVGAKFKKEHAKGTPLPISIWSMWALSQYWNLCRLLNLLMKMMIILLKNLKVQSMWSLRERASHLQNLLLRLPRKMMRDFFLCLLPLVLQINIVRTVTKFFSINVIYQDLDWAKINKEEFIL